MKNYIAVTSKGCRGRLGEVVFYEGFQLKGFDWEKFGILDKWSLTRGGRTWRFDCMALSFCFVSGRGPSWVLVSRDGMDSWEAIIDRPDSIVAFRGGLSSNFLHFT